MKIYKTFESFNENYDTFDNKSGKPFWGDYGAGVRCGIDRQKIRRVLQNTKRLFVPVGPDALLGMLRVRVVL